MKRSFRTPALTHLMVSWMAAVGTAAWALAGTADTPKEPGTRPHAASGPHSDGADAVLQTRQRAGNTSKVSKSDQQFLSKAAAAGRAEVEMGRLGQTRAQSSEVKSFAERMVQDHTRVYGELQALGSSRGLLGPDDTGTTSTASSRSDRLMEAPPAAGIGARPSSGPGSNTASSSTATPGTGMPMASMGSADGSHPKLSASAQHSLDRLQGLNGAEFDREFMKQMVTDHKAAVADFQRAATSASDPEVKTFAQKTLPGLQEHLQLARSLSERLAASERR